MSTADLATILVWVALALTVLDAALQRRVLLWHGAVALLALAMLLP